MSTVNKPIDTIAAPLAWQLAFRGSVNRWECDENDHLNVRFYSRMVGEALANAIEDLGLRRPAALQLQHMRYLAEARLATPVSGFVALAGVAVFIGHAYPVWLTELRHSFTGTVLAAFLTDLHAPGHGQPESADQPLPAHAGPRGLAMADTPYGQLSRAQAMAHGFHVVGKGVIAASECDAAGDLTPHALMGRLSDGMPNLWSVFQTAEEQAARANGFQGGAVLEYRMCRTSAGTRRNITGSCAPATGTRSVPACVRSAASCSISCTWSSMSPPASVSPAPKRWPSCWTWLPAVQLKYLQSAGRACWRDVCSQRGRPEQRPPAQAVCPYPRRTLFPDG